MFAPSPLLGLQLNWGMYLSSPLPTEEALQSGAGPLGATCTIHVCETALDGQLLRLNWMEQIHSRARDGVCC